MTIRFDNEVRIVVEVAPWNRSTPGQISADAISHACSAAREGLGRKREMGFGDRCP
ncbi:MAG: hypothetical protein PVG92_07065 [Holophagae bacterium]|jgi:hypothetical protein